MKRFKVAPFKWVTFSTKQIQLLTWWMSKSPVKDKDAIIADGSVRSGKTQVMSFSYILWAMTNFDGQNFGVSGKTIGALRRNVIQPLKRILRGRNIRFHEHRSENYLIITYKGNTNVFYLFGGKDESSQDLIQGVTLAGMLFDEVALMPKSFVDQATARCSVEGAKLWFNCNPAGPYHWFKQEWLDQLGRKNAVHLHFTMEDNFSLSEKVKNRYKRMYSGVFFKRFILGLWVMAEGIIYDMFDEERHVIRCPDSHTEYGVAVDYATATVMTFGLYGVTWDKKTGLPIVFLIKEYFYDAKKRGRQKTDGEFAEDFIKFVGNIIPQNIYVDPSAASFKVELKKKGFSQVRDANNDVISGIRIVGTFLANDQYFLDVSCKDSINEMYSYTWDEKAQERGEDKPVKKFDHTRDRDRYFIYTRFGKARSRALGRKPRGW